MLNDTNYSTKFKACGTTYCIPTDKRASHLEIPIRIHWQNYIQNIFCALHKFLYGIMAESNLYKHCYKIVNLIIMENIVACRRVVK
jgi:hypothetical protein